MNINRILVLLLIFGILKAASSDDGRARLELLPTETAPSSSQDPSVDTARIAGDSLRIKYSAIPESTSRASINNPSGLPIRKRWPTGALFRSAVIPGWGQVYNRQYLKAVINGGAEIALALATRDYWRQMNAHQRNFMNSTDLSYKSQEFRLYENSRDNRNLYLWLTGLTAFISMFDAYVDAHFADFKQTDKAFEASLMPATDGIRLNFSFYFK